MDRRTKHLKSCDGGATEYVILSHRWIKQEVDYDETVELAQMDGEERDEIHQRDGCQKILQSCEQAQKDGYEWLWVDTCCIDKRSSAELSIPCIDGMKVCYVYLHDVPNSWFPTVHVSNDEWFSCGWTPQELIAPKPTFSSSTRIGKA